MRRPTPRRRAGAADRPARGHIPDVRGGAIGRPVAASQRQAVPPLLEVSTYRSSGLKTARFTGVRPSCWSGGATGRAVIASRTTVDPS